MQAHNANHSEKDHVRTGAILKFGIILVVVAAFMHIVVWFLFEYFRNQTTMQQRALTPLASRQQILPPEPRLQVNPVLDLEQALKADEKRLRTYGWVDEKNGIVHIPIERAMEIVAQRGNVK